MQIILLTILYANGQGVPQDYKAAVRWYTKAAEQGDENAQVNLGLMYDDGTGVPQDKVHAYMWFSIAAVNGDDDATKNRDRVAREMTPDQMAEAQRFAREWMATH